MEKEFTIRDLTSRGWTRREDLDFRDDGNKFKALQHTSGLIATYTKVNGEYFLALRLDYMDDLCYNEYSTLNSYELCNEFNGVSMVDAEKVTQNAIQIMKEYNQKLKELDNHKVDLQKLIKAAEKELEMVYRVLYASNVGIDELELINEYEINRLRDYRKLLKQMAENTLSRLAGDQYSVKELRNLEYMYDKFGYVTVDEKNSFYIKEIKSIVRKITGGK